MIGFTDVILNWKSDAVGRLMCNFDIRIKGIIYAAFETSSIELLIVEIFFEKIGSNEQINL